MSKKRQDRFYFQQNADSLLEGMVFEQPETNSTGIPEIEERNRLQVFSDALTIIENIPIQRLEDEIQKLCNSYVEDDEINSESGLLMNLYNLIILYNMGAVLMLHNMISNGSFSSRMAKEVLSLVGDIQDSYTKSNRIWLLGKSLLSSSKYIRDGAITGFANMDDPETIDFLKRACETEKVPLLKRIIQKVIIQLERE